MVTERPASRAYTQAVFSPEAEEEEIAYEKLFYGSCFLLLLFLLLFLLLWRQLIRIPRAGEEGPPQAPLSQGKKDDDSSIRVQNQKANFATPEKSSFSALQYARDVLAKIFRFALRRVVVAFAQVWSSCGLVGRSIQDDILLLQPFFPFFLPFLMAPHFLPPPPTTKMLEEEDGRKFLQRYFPVGGKKWSL